MQLNLIIVSFASLLSFGEPFVPCLCPGSVLNEKKKKKKKKDGRKFCGPGRRAVGR